VERTPELLNDLDALILHAREEARPLRRRKRWVVTGVATAVLLGAAGTAAATGLSPFSWPSEQGATCTITGATVELASGDDNESKDAFAGTTPEERRRTLDEARRYLAAYDFAAIDLSRAIKAYQEENAAARAAQPDVRDWAPPPQGDELEVAALLRQQGRDLASHLDELGLNPDVVVLVQSYGGSTGIDGYRCDG
jgi:hypothetical protein